MPDVALCGIVPEKAEWLQAGSGLRTASRRSPAKAGGGRPGSSPSSARRARRGGPSGCRLHRPIRFRTRGGILSRAVRFNNLQGCPVPREEAPGRRLRALRRHPFWRRLPADGRKPGGGLAAGRGIARDGAVSARPHAGRRARGWTRPPQHGAVSARLRD